MGFNIILDITLIGFITKIMDKYPVKLLSKEKPVARYLTSLEITTGVVRTGVVGGVKNDC